MIQITVACTGSVKEAYLLQGINEYTKRLSAYCRLRTAEVKDEKTPASGQISEEQRVKDREGERLLGVIPQDAYVIALSPDGKMPDSIQFSKRMDQLALSGKSHVVFVIGGSLGLSDAVRKRSDEIWSFSRLTFPHQLFRLILLEQLYRSFRISRGEPYHK